MEEKITSWQHHFFRTISHLWHTLYITVYLPTQRLDYALLLKKQQAFTLVELLVVISVLSILTVASIGLLDPLGQLQKAQDAKRKLSLSEVQKALETYYQDHGRYPESSTDFRITGVDESGVVTFDWGERWSVYMERLPKDPTGTKTYRYFSNGQAYYLYASLDRGGKDPQACNSGSACDTVAINGPFTCGSDGQVCDYGVTSTNVSP